MLEVIIKFEDLADKFITIGRPDKIYINEKDVDIFEYMYPSFFIRENLKNYWEQGLLGAMFGIPVLSGVISTKKVKLLYKNI